MSQSLVSVIIPAYNSKQYIRETITSVLNQSHSNMEVIIVDDGSTDGQMEIIREFCEKDSRVRYIYKSNEGVSVARNTGFNHSSGSYIAFLDADDVWLSDNLALKLRKFENENYGLVHSDAYLIDEHSIEKEGILCGNEGDLLRDILEWKGTQVPGPSSILIKREVLNTIGLFDTCLSTSADHDLFLRIAAKYRIGRVAQLTWKYRLHPTNMHKRIAVMEKDILHLYKKASSNNLFDNYWFERRCYVTMYMVLAASWAGDGENKMKAFQFASLALITHPIAISNIVNRLKKQWF